MGGCNKQQSGAEVVGVENRQVALTNPSSANLCLHGEPTLKVHFKTLILINNTPYLSHSFFPLIYNVSSLHCGMSAAQSTSQNPTWTEPPWSGWIETTGDALLILEAARRGLIPRVTRRLVDSERKMITSGSVFVFDEDESGIKRWTDGFFWSPSRILGNFLLYRETDKKGAGNRGVRPDPDTSEQSQYTLEGARSEGQTLSRPKTDSGLVGVNKQRERTLMGSLTNSYKFKPDGLMKKVRYISYPPLTYLTELNSAIDLLSNHRRRLAAPYLLLQNRRCREWTPSASVFPPRASLSRH